MKHTQVVIAMIDCDVKLPPCDKLTFLSQIRDVRFFSPLYGRYDVYIRDDLIMKIPGTVSVYRLALCNAQKRR